MQSYSRGICASNESISESQNHWRITSCALSQYAEILFSESNRTMIPVYSQEDHDQMCSRSEYRARSKSTASNRVRAKVCARLSRGKKSLYSRQSRSDSFLLHFWRDLQPFPTKILSIGLLSLQFHPQNPKNRHASIRFSPGDDLLCCTCACHSSPQCKQLQSGSTSAWSSILHGPCFQWI